MLVLAAMWEEWQVAVLVIVIGLWGLVFGYIMGRGS